MKQPRQYFSLVRKELFDFIPDGSNQVLEVGCGDGATLVELKKLGKAKKVIGIEIDQAAAARAAKVLDQIIVGDVEVMKLPFRRGQFDAVMCPDVLEHLVDPWKVLQRLRPLLSPKGHLIVSVPNVQHFSVLKSLLSGRWDYSKAGIMDRTHLRWFTRSTIVEALELAGYDVLAIRTNGGHLVGWKKWLDWLSGGRIAPWFVAQYLILAKPKA